MFAPDLRMEEALRFSRFDTEHMLSTCARPIQLAEFEWLSAEHYLHANLVRGLGWAEKIRAAPTGLDAYKLAKPWYRAKKPSWKKLRAVYLTRALYTQVQMYPEVRDFLINTEDQFIVETSMYDHFWGIGRDQRGVNATGKIWMDIRRKIREDSALENSKPRRMEN